MNIAYNTIKIYGLLRIGFTQNFVFQTWLFLTKIFNIFIKQALIDNNSRFRALNPYLAPFTLKLRQKWLHYRRFIRVFAFYSKCIYAPIFLQIYLAEIKGNFGGVLKQVISTFSTLVVKARALSP